MYDRATIWRKSTFSWGKTNCVEVTELAGMLIGIRDSKNPRGHVLRFTTAQWQVFLDGVNSGAAD